MNTIVSFILVLGVLIFVHELGHFIFAKLFGVRVLKFSLGFGPKLLGKVVGGTEYVISAFPLGGFVKMFGENPDEQQIDEADREVSFSHKSVMARFCIVIAGPLYSTAICSRASPRSGVCDAISTRPFSIENFTARDRSFESSDTRRMAAWKRSRSNSMRLSLFFGMTRS